jgi:hypothetical protein
MPKANLRVLQSALIMSLMGLIDDPAFAASQQDYDTCSQTQDINLSIAACTRIADAQSEAPEDRIGALLQIGNDYYGLNNLGKALDAYRAAQSVDAKRSSHDALVVQIDASMAIAEWRTYQIGHDPVHQMVAIAAFNGAATMDSVYHANFNALVDGNSTLQEIKSYIESLRKK